MQVFLLFIKNLTAWWEGPNARVKKSMLMIETGTSLLFLKKLNENYF